MKVAPGTHSCLLGIRLTIAPDSTLGQVAAKIARLEPLVARMAKGTARVDGAEVELPG